jgi:tetratricopeptide (TPR) repeat protein
VLGGVFFRSPLARIQLCWITAINGVALAFFGLVQQLTWNGLLYWQVPLEQGGQPFGPFVDRNHAGGFLTLCLAGAIGATIWRKRHIPNDRELPSDDEYPFTASAWRRVQQSIHRFLHRWDEASLIAMLLAAFIFAGVLCSLSRGSVLSLIAAALVTSAVIAMRRHHRVYVAGIILVMVCGVGVMSWVGMTGRLGARLATVVEREILTEGRVPNWCDGLKATRDFWPVGSGLGTFRYLYSLYEDRRSVGWYYHAENQYLETLLEAGVPGLLLLMLLLGLVARSAWRLASEESTSQVSWFGIAGIFAITGQALHSIGDFDLYMPANLMLLALFCGSLSASPTLRHGRGPVAHGGNASIFSRILAHRWMTVGLAGLFLLSLSLAWWESWRQAGVEAALAASHFAETPDAASADDISTAITRLTAAMQTEKDHAVGHQRLAELWIHLYRIRALAELHAESPPGTTDAQLWPFTSLTVLHKRASAFDQARSLQDLSDLRSDPVVVENLLPALEHLAQARHGCPLLPMVELLLAQVAFLADDPGTDRGPLERARRLAPSDARVFFWCGLLDIDAGRIESGLRTWRRCLDLDPARFDEIYSLAQQRAEPLLVIEQLTPDRAELLVKLAHHVIDQNTPDAKQSLAARLVRLAASPEMNDAQRHYLQGLAWHLSSAAEKAIGEYQEAVRLDPQKDQWHFELALLLKQQGRLSEAYQQALLCNRLEPENRDYSDLLRNIYPSNPSP